MPGIDRSKLETGEYKFPGLAENRGQERIPQRELGLVVMAIRLPGPGNWLPVELWDFTSISFGVTYAPEAPVLDPAGSSPLDDGPLDIESLPLSVHAGDEVEVRIQVTHHQDFRIWCQVKNIVPWKDGVKIGLRRLDMGFPQSVDIDRREAYRLALTPGVDLNVRIKHPFVYGHWCRLKVSDMNRNMGLSLECHDPSILVFEGMELRLQFELAAHRESEMEVRVAWVHATEANHVKFGVECLDMEWSLHNAICGYLMLSRQWTPERLKGAGFRAQHVKSRLRFRTVKTMTDYAEVLHLRKDAFVGVGKESETTRPEDMAHRLDGVSRILMAHHLEKLVGSLTFTFPTSEEMILDSQTGFPGGKYPVALPPKANVIEVSRLCIDGEYRSTDVLQGLFEHGIKHFLMSDRHWLLTSAVSELLPSYQRIGFKTLGASYRHPALNNKEHHLIMAHRDAFLMGKGMNLFVWNTLFGDVVRHLLEGNLITLGRFKRTYILAKLRLRSLSGRVLENEAKRSFRRHLDTLRRVAVSARAERPEKSVPVTDPLD
ncbi:MAG: type pilus assembly PilZ [Fibrobacteres bacterium]|nr:type pilus assembly PilZ [Fibrobacterota bacterium]